MKAHLTALIFVFIFGIAYVLGLYYIYVQQEEAELIPKCNYEQLLIEIAEKDSIIAAKEELIIILNNEVAKYHKRSSHSLIK